MWTISSLLCKRFFSIFQSGFVSTIIWVWSPKVRFSETYETKITTASGIKTNIPNSSLSKTTYIIVQSDAFPSKNCKPYAQKCNRFVTVMFQRYAIKCICQCPVPNVYSHKWIQRIHLLQYRFHFFSTMLIYHVDQLLKKLANCTCIVLKTQR